ncbi:MAG: DUF6340 family protein [Opitutaceae bacterium]
MKILGILPAVSASILGLLGLAGCSSTRSVSMNAMNPAEMTFPKEIRTILIVDRSEFHDGTVGLLESVLTGEIPDQDRKGLQTMISELRNQLAWSGRFRTVVASEVLPGNSLTGVFPDPLDWSQIDTLTRKYSADAVLSIEIFDSDFIITDGRRLVKKTVKEEGGETEVQVTEYFAEGVANMNIGFRIYDPKSRDILDEDIYSRTNRWEARGSSLQDALLALDDKMDAARRVSRQVGVEYAYRIAPMPTQVSRTFYGKSKHVREMEEGGRQADVGDWAGAARTWEAGLNFADTKDAGRLCYNIAIACEVQGDWKNARKWAERAYVEYANKEARDYLNELDRRVWREELAMDQMK